MEIISSLYSPAYIISPLCCVVFKKGNTSSLEVSIRGHVGNVRDSTFQTQALINGDVNKLLPFLDS